MKNKSHNLSIFRAITGKTCAKIPDTSDDIRSMVKQLGYWPDRSGMFMKR